jgi:hypothetical protein
VQNWVSSLVSTVFETFSVKFSEFTAQPSHLGVLLNCDAPRVLHSVVVCKGQGHNCTDKGGENQDQPEDPLSNSARTSGQFKINFGLKNSQSPEKNNWDFFCLKSSLE